LLYEDKYNWKFNYIVPFLRLICFLTANFTWLINCILLYCLFPIYFILKLPITFHLIFKHWFNRIIILINI
jgi:hypothetical protein